MTTTTQQVARTIHQQIPVMDKMATGFRNPQAMSETEERRGGLRFKVNRAMQYVEVELMWNDTYNVTYFRMKRGTHERVTLAVAETVYCDTLGTTVYNMTQATEQYNTEQGGAV